MLLHPILSSCANVGAVCNCITVLRVWKLCIVIIGLFWSEGKNIHMDMLGKYNWPPVFIEREEILVLMVDKYQVSG